MRFLFLNQYAPPEAAPTARLLGELASSLRCQGHEVEMISQTQTYSGRPAGGGERLKREILALWTILRRGWNRTDPSPDAILALSSPPGLLVVAAVLSWRHRIPLVHWAMDLYPELAFVLGELRSRVLRFVLQRAMRWAYHRCALIIALDNDMRHHLQDVYRLSGLNTMAPWPAFGSMSLPTAVCQPDLHNADSPWTWLYSGNLGRAHEWKTLLDAQRMLEVRGLFVRLIFQGDGAARQEAMSYATQNNLQRCEWRGYVADENLVAELCRADALVVTQKSTTKGLLWPSKLALLERLPRPIIYVGPADSAIAQRLIQRAGSTVCQPGNAQWLAQAIEGYLKDGTPQHQPLPLANQGRENCDLVVTWLISTSQRCPDT